jgi:hypothetical protein
MSDELQLSERAGSEDNRSSDSEGLLCLKLFRLSSDAELIVIHCRVNQVSLVCKAWQRVERKYPHRPVRLQLRSEDFNSAFMTWHLRDTSRLETVAVEVEVVGNYEWGYLFQTDDYHEWMLRLLNHLSDKAPALRSLAIAPPRLMNCYSLNNQRKHHFDYMPLVGTLSRLESLALMNWEYSVDEAPLIAHLTSLQNLKVPRLSQKHSHIKQLCQLVLQSQ